MTKLTMSLAAAGTAALLAITPPAFAGGPPYEIRVGINTSGAHAFTATSVGPVTLQFNIGTPNTMDCTAGTLSGQINAGINSTGLDIAAITSSTWANCVGTLFSGLPMEVTQIEDWAFNATGNTATNGLGDLVSGNVSDFHARVSAAPLTALCDFNVAGTVDAEFDELNQQLLVDGQFSVTSLTSGCLGRINTSDTGTLEAVYNLYTPGGVINITD